MTSSTFSGLCIVLFPHVTCPLVLLEYVVDDVRSQLGINPLGLLLVWSLHSSILLFEMYEEMRATSGEECILHEVH